MVKPAPSIEHEALIAYDVWLCERVEFRRQGFPEWHIWAVVFGGVSVFLACLIFNFYALIFGSMEYNLNRLQEIAEWQPWRP